MSTQPSITLITPDYERLERLLASLPESAFPGRAALERELHRADIVDPDELSETVVTMNSTVEFTVNDSDEAFRLTLVYPGDTGEHTISILAPVGSALLGLKVGDEIDWPAPGGGRLRVRIREIQSRAGSSTV